MKDEFNIEGALNTLYRNFPGWFYENVDTVEKVKKTEEKKKPVIEKVKAQGDSAKERKAQDSYDEAGSEIRNQVRLSGLYTRLGKKTSF